MPHKYAAWSLCIMIAGIFLLRNYVTVKCNNKYTCDVIVVMYVVCQLGHMHCYCTGINYRHAYRNALSRASNDV